MANARPKWNQMRNWNIYSAGTDLDLEHLVWNEQFFDAKIHSLEFNRDALGPGAQCCETC